ncbi:MAG TPA: arylesterase [Noviherbaspirillum sp.]|nr:arylesterase [Noviherbaspirillum sp.]
MLAMIATSAYSASKTVLVLGDSLSAEYGLVRGTGWVPLLEKRLDSKKIDARVVNASISGDTTSGGKARLPALLRQHHPDVVIIELGANDGLRGLPIAAAKANLHAIIDATRDAHAKVLLVGMQIPPNYGRDYTGKFAGMYADLARELKVPLVPFLLDGVADKPQLFQADRLHPVAAAQPAILDNVWPRLKPLLHEPARR